MEKAKAMGIDPFTGKRTPAERENVRREQARLRQAAKRERDREERLNRPAQVEAQAKARVRKPRKLKPCGTEAAYARHLKRGEPIDDLCREGSSKERSLRRNKGKPEGWDAEKPCGTLAARSRHKRLGEPVDEACRLVYNEDARKRRADNKVSECGTEGGFRAHRRSYEQACGECREAHAIFAQEHEQMVIATKVALIDQLGLPETCGTSSGYSAHRRAGEPFDEACKIIENLRHWKLRDAKLLKEMESYENEDQRQESGSNATVNA